MKVKSHSTKKILKYYSIHFGFRKPYQILIDGTFCFAALKSRVNIKNTLHNAIGEENVKLLTTKCVIMECEIIGPRLNQTASVAKQYSIHRCAHSKTLVTGAECIKSMIEGGNPNRYIIATQDDSLKTVVRSMPGVPHIYINHSKIIFAKPAKITQKAVENKISSLNSLTVREQQHISKLKVEAGIEEHIEPQPKRKKPIKKKKKKRKVTK